jgi:hypothetical protein
MSSAPAGWYPDPFGRFDDRYSDGFQWTARIRMGHSEGTDPLGVEHEPPAEHGPQLGEPDLPASSELPAPWIPAPSYPPPPPVAPRAPAPYAAPQLPTVSGFAIASLVLGILWLYWVGTVLALVFGYIALSQIKRSNGWKTGRGMAIAGVVLGYVGVAMFALVVILVAANSGNGSRTHFDVDTDPANGICNESRYMQDPDCG